MLTVLAALALQAAAPPPPAPAAPAAPPTPAAAVPAPDAAADQAVRAATRDFLDARDEGRYDQAWAMLSPAGQARRPHDPWVAAARDFNAQAGALRGRRITAVSWLENPGGLAGIFGVVEYDGDYAELVFLCGIVIWERQPDGGWRVLREVTHGARRADAPNATPEQIAEGRRQNQCRD
ncbi:MAG TPA: DUF4019 domain-containing protein [Allosphingosinicella sp.]|nr:DUF4019 domain-containing protein [Allosphingosinicella sp.]